MQTTSETPVQKDLRQLNLANDQLKIIIRDCENAIAGKRLTPLSDDPIINKTFGIATSISSTLDRVKAGDNEEGKKLAQEVQTNISQILTRVETLKQTLRSKLPCTKESLLQVIKNNEIAVLALFRDKYIGRNRPELMGYAFRVASAGGKIDCLRCLGRHRSDYFLLPGEATNKIAIQFAAENGHTEVIEFLLNLVNVDDYFQSYDQLMHGQKGNRAIDLIANFPDKEKRAEMLTTVSNVLNSSESHLYTAKTEEVVEVRKTLSESLQAFRQPTGPR